MQVVAQERAKMREKKRPTFRFRAKNGGFFKLNFSILLKTLISGQKIGQISVYLPFSHTAQANRVTWSPVLQPVRPFCEIEVDIE